MEDKIIKILQKNPNGLTITQIVKTSKLTRDQVRITIARMEGKELIEIREVGMAKLIILKTKG